MTFSSKTALQVAALQIRNEHADKANTAIRIGDEFSALVNGAVLAYDPQAFGTFTANDSSTATANANTASLQAAIDAARAAGSGVVMLPAVAGTFWLGASTLAETYWNYGVPVLASEGCISMRDGVTLRGRGVGKTILKPSSPTLDVIHVVDGNNQTIDDIEIDGGWTAAGAGHGILQVTSANNTATTVENLTIRNYYGHDLGSYGIGIENGVFTNVLVENFRTKNTGADGIDVKNRPLPANASRGIVLRGLYIENPGRRLDGQTGVDVRGICEASGITVVGVGRAGVEMNGIRFRTYGVDEGWGDRSSLTNFYVKGGDPSFNVSGGLQSGSANVAIGVGVIEDCANGVWLTGNGTAQADNNTLNGVIVINATTRGFYVETAIDHTKWIGCIAVSCLLGFRNEGQNTAIIGCSAPGSTTPRSTSAGALQTEVLIEGNLQQDSLSMTYLTAGRVALEARGASAVIDIALVPKGGGVLRMGTWTANADAPVNGYLTIRDEAGNVRKLATIA